MSPVVRSERHLALRNLRHNFCYVRYYPCSPPLRKSYIMCESLMHWGFRIGFLYDYHVFLAEEFLRVGYPLVGSVFSEWR